MLMICVTKYIKWWIGHDKSDQVFPYWIIMIFKICDLFDILIELIFLQGK